LQPGWWHQGLGTRRPTPWLPAHRVTSCAFTGRYRSVVMSTTTPSTPTLSCSMKVLPVAGQFKKEISHWTNWSLDGNGQKQRATAKS
jgi:hypothetical protein